MTEVRHVHRHLEVACNLGGAESIARLARWQSLRDRSGLGAEPTVGGARLWLRAEVAPLVYELVEQEAECCGFLDFEVASEDDRVRLDVTSPVPEGVRVAALLAGLTRSDGVPR